MTNQDDMIKLIKSISGQANILTIPRVYIGFTKSHRAALFLSQCVYWSDRSRLPDGWFYKSFREWHDELGLNQHAVETCVKTLKAGEWLHTKIETVATSPTTFYRADLDQIAISIRSYLSDPHIAETYIAETAKYDEEHLAETAKLIKRKTISTSIKQKLSSETTDHGAEKAPRPRDLLFDAIAKVTGVDPATAGGSIGKVKQALLKAIPPYTADEVLKFGASWPAWKDTPPTLWQLKEQIGHVRQNGKGSSNGTHQEHNEPANTPEQLAAAAEINRRRAEKLAAHE